VAPSTRVETFGGTEYVAFLTGKKSIWRQRLLSTQASIENSLRLFQLRHGSPSTRNSPEGSTLGACERTKSKAGEQKKKIPRELQLELSSTVSLVDNNFIPT